MEISRPMRFSSRTVRQAACLAPHPRREKKIEVVMFAHVAPSDKKTEQRTEKGPARIVVARREPGNQVTR